jgi:membrane associated rhomboid family serine protease
MFEELAVKTQQLLTLLQTNAAISINFIAAIWILHLVNFFIKYKLNYLGILPRHLFGLVGIVFSPFLHGNFNHLFFNTFPLFVLSDLVLIEGVSNFYCASGMIIVVSGALLWLFGRDGIHIGASGLIMGYFGYLLTKAYLNITATTVILAGISLYYFGGLFLCLFPGAQKNISWDGHIFGFAAGIITAFYLKKVLLVMI